MTAETVLREKIATCTRIFAMQQMIGLFGHISAYDPATGRVYMCPGMGVQKSTVADADVLALDLDGKVLDGEGRIPAEWPIHTVLHGKRSDALAVAHLHAPAATLFSLVDRAFRPVTLQGCIFADGVPLYDQPRLVRTVEQGRELAGVVGDSRAALMRGHGIVVVGRDVEEMLFGALILEDEVRKWAEASAIGTVRPFSEEEAGSFDAASDFQRRSHRCWDYFCGIEQRWDRQPGTGRAGFA